MDSTELRKQILTEFRQVLKLAPADYTENCTNVVMSLIEAHTSETVAEAEGRGKYLATSILSMHVGYLLAHRAQGLPKMTSQVIGELWESIKSVQAENEKYMRNSQLKATHQDTQNTQDNRVSGNDLHNNGVSHPDKGGSDAA